ARHRRRRGTGIACGELGKEADAVAERPRLDLEERAGATILAVLRCVLLDLVDDGATGLAPRDRHVARPVGGNLEGEPVPQRLAESDQLAGAAGAVGLHLDLGPLIRRA